MEMLGEWLGRAGEIATNFISSAGYLGVFALMFVDSTNIPIPSELVLGFSGYLVSKGEFGFWLAVLAATAGFTAGAAFSYWLGYAGGRPLLKRWGKFLLVTQRDLDRADKLFAKYGNWIAFFSRMIPLLRTFISIPAGITRMPFGRYITFTFLGSGVWSLVLTYVGKLIGENYAVIEDKVKGYQYVVVGFLILSLLFWVWHFVHEQREIRRELKSSSSKVRE